MRDFLFFLIDFLSALNVDVNEEVIPLDVEDTTTDDTDTEKVSINSVSSNDSESFIGCGLFVFSDSGTIFRSEDILSDSGSSVNEDAVNF